ncbi:MAG: acyl-CoA thioesterase [Akkermansiaceae bacterium]|nr:acyl-CoA thioesterase [Akkermansiaceae bacterium]
MWRYRRQRLDAFPECIQIHRGRRTLVSPLSRNPGILPGKGGWPRVKVSCDYKRPLQCGDKIETLLGISRVGASSITWDFQVKNAAGEIAAFGSMTTVRVDHLGRPSVISESDRQQLGASS